MVLRDHRVAVVDWRCKSVPHADDPLYLEALACRETVVLAHNYRLSNIMIEGDCKELINTLFNEPFPVQIRGLVFDIKRFSEDLQSVTFAWIPRSQN